MNAYKRLDISSGDNDTYVVKTVARIGCDAVLVWRLDSAGNDHILMTHYPPNQIKRHLQVLRESFPRGEGEIRSVLLTAGKETAGWSKELTDYIEEASGVVPDIIRINGDDTRDAAGIKRLVLVEDGVAYQLIFTKGYNGKPQVRRITVPAPSTGNVYEKIFDLSS